MKILHIATGVTSVLSDSRRSVENSIYQLSKGQAKLGHNVGVVDVKSCNRSEALAVKIWELRNMPIVGSSIFSYLLRVAIFTIQLPLVLCKNREVDIIHTHSQFPTVVAVIAKKLFGLKASIFYTAHNPYLMMPSNFGDRLKHTLIEGWVLRRVDRVVAQTKATGEEISKRFGVKSGKMVQIYAGVDIEAINEFTKHNPRKVNSHKMVLYPAFVNQRKNQMALVKAIPYILSFEPNCSFVFAGGIEDEGYYNEIQEFVTERGIVEAEFKGQVPQRELFKLYRKAAVFVFPTLYETQGVVLLEAMAFGLPIVASDIKVIRDVIELKKGCALLVKPDDSEEIGKAVVGILQKKRLRGRLVKSGKNLVSERFGWEKIASDMLIEYKKALC